MVQSHLLTHAAISCTANTGSLCSSGILAQPARTTRRSSRQPVVFTQLSPRKQEITRHTSRRTSSPTRTATTSPSCSTRTRSCQVLLSFPSQKPPPAKTWGLAALVARGLLPPPSVVDSPTITFCSVHLHNKVAKKRDASTSLFLRLREHMINHSVDNMGGDNHGQIRRLLKTLLETGSVHT